ncbi:MAG: hypothetical protein LBC49_04850 [Bacteroidales bacterium]|nr:hypothetical protein [Bacteroidales bacterium]
MSKISLSDISKIGVKRILDYREISERYPYCSCAKTLYLLSLKKLDDPDFNKVLSQTAISVPDRKYLASLIEKISPAKSNATVSSNIDNRFFKFTPVFDSTETAISTATISDTLFGQQNKQINVESVVNLLHNEKTTPGATVSAVEVSTPSAISATNFYIDKFLNNPQEHKPIKVNTNKDYSQIKIDNSSIKEDLSFGTEAIAKLYAEQGNPKKAVEIYHNLIDRHPEKSLYYRSLIRKLRV